MCVWGGGGGGGGGARGLLAWPLKEALPPFWQTAKTESKCHGMPYLIRI